MKNKLLISFILFIIFIFWLTGVCSASSYTTITAQGIRNNETYTINIPLADYDCSYYIIYDNIPSDESKTQFFCYMSSVPLTFYSKYSSQYDATYYYPQLNSSVGTVYMGITYVTNSKSVFFESLSPHSGGYEYVTFNIMASNYDIYTVDGDLVFQEAPSQEVTIPAIQQVEEIPQVMGQVMKILIPIGLIVFSIGLVIYLTRLVISRVQ